MLNKKPIGKVKITFDQAGLPVSTVFVPAEVKPDTTVKGVKPQPVRSEADAVAYATRALAYYFVYIGNVEMADPDLAGITHEILVCDKLEGQFRYCEIGFFLTEKSPVSHN